MKKEEIIQLCINAHQELKKRYRTHSPEVLLEEIIARIQKEK